MRAIGPDPGKRTVLLLRGALAVAVASLATSAPAGEASLHATALLGLFLLSMAALILMPADAFRAGRLDLGMVLLDTLFLVALIHYTCGSGPGAFLAFFVIVLLSAVAASLARAVISATLAIVIYASVSASAGAYFPGMEFLPRIPFFYMVAVYYGYFVHLSGLRQSEAARDRQERDHLRAVLDVMESTTSSLELHQVLYTVTIRIARHLGSNRCSVLRIDPEEDPDRAVVIASSDDPAVDGLGLDLNLYPEVRRAIETRRPVILANILEDEVMAGVRDRLRGLAFRSLVVVPMIHADRIVGSLILRAATPRSFTPEQVRFARVVAGAASNAVRNALLHGEAIRRVREHQEDREKLQRILDGSPDLILAADTEGSVTEFSTGAARALGFPREEMIGKPLASLFERNQDFAVLWTRAAQGETAGVLNTALRQARGGSREVSLSYSALTDATGEVTGAVAVGRDVSEIKRAQEQILQAHRLSSLGTVIADVAHEMNNPLSAVVGYSQLLLSREGKAGPELRMLQTIHDSAWRCQRIVHNLLSFASRQESEKRYLGLNGILDKVLDLKSYALSADGITVDRDYDAQLPRTMVDFHRMEQVIVNLLNNAHQALLRIPRGRRIVVRTRRDGDRIVLEVVDNGPGIDPEHVGRVFDPFFTTKAPGEGAGLGLSVSYGVVRDHGGELTVQSARGLGATFALSLPIVEPPPEAQQPEQEETGAQVLPGTGKRVLVVDDEPAVLDLFIDVLSRFPMQVDTAHNGTEAMRKIQQHYYDLVISDVRMPEMDGPTLFREVARRRPEMVRRMVFTTGDLAGGASRNFLEMAHLPVIRKPIDIRQVVEVVGRATGAEA